MNMALRNFALALLDDEHGINKEAFDCLSDMLYDDEQEDVIDAVDATEGRFYLTEENANMLRQVQND